MASTSKWKRTRKLFNDIHLWLGIGAGLILFVVCLTGTIYTFHTEIDEWVNSEKYHINASSYDKPIPVEQLAEKLKQQKEGQVASVSISTDSDAYKFSVRKEGERRGSNYLVNQYTGEILGDTKSNTSEFFMLMFRLHRWLMLDTSIGRPIVGWSTVIFIFIIITGLVIWIPQKVKSWKQGLKIKWSSNWKRVNHDLHNALGFYTAFFLLIMALTGLQWSFDWYRTGLQGVLGINEPERGRERPETKPEPHQELDTLIQKLSVEELMVIADKELPYKGTYRVELPSNKKNTINLNKYHTGFFASPASDIVSINVYTGKVQSKEIFSEKPFNEKIARSIKALHVGDVFGVFSKIIYFISCLIATSLPVTGTIIWINKLRKKAKRKNKSDLIVYD